METVNQYRHIVDKKTAKIFEKALKKVVSENKPKKLGFLGIIQSTKKEYHHDIDVLIFPGKKAKLGEALIELIKIYDKVEAEIKKENERYYLATCPMMSMQQLIYYIATIEEGSAGLIPIHSLFFPNYRDFKRFNPRDFQKEIKKHLISIYGDFDVIKELPELPQEILEPYFFVLNFELNARIKTFPRHSMRASAEHLFNYLKTKYRIQINDKVPHNPKEIEKEFIKLMRKLDKITYS
jgi:hypothetical protein